MSFQVARRNPLEAAKRKLVSLFGNVCKMKNAKANVSSATCFSWPIYRSSSRCHLNLTEKFVRRRSKECAIHRSDQRQPRYFDRVSPGFARHAWYNDEKRNERSTRTHHRPSAVEISPRVQTFYFDSMKLLYLPMPGCYCNTRRASQSKPERTEANGTRQKPRRPRLKTI